MQDIPHILHALLGQVEKQDCLSASEVTLKDMGKVNIYQTTTKQKLHV